MGTVLNAGFDSLHILNPKAEARLEKSMRTGSPVKQEIRSEPAQEASGEGRGGEGRGPSTGSRQKELIGTTWQP